MYQRWAKKSGTVSSPSAEKPVENKHPLVFREIKQGGGISKTIYVQSSYTIKKYLKILLDFVNLLSSYIEETASI